MQLGIWDESLRLERLSQLGDSLERLDSAINWELFRPRLTKVFKKEAKGACPIRFNGLPVSDERCGQFG